MAAVQVSADAGDRAMALSGEGFSAEVLVSPFNQRLQVLEFDARQPAEMVRELEAVAREHAFGKVFLKSPLSHREELEAAGMAVEATIDGYFDGSPAAVMSLFLDEDRSRSGAAARQQEILDSITARPADPSVPDLPDGYQMRPAEPSDAEQLAGLYDEVFASYPFPITEPLYLVETMRSHVVYRIVRTGEGRLVAAASAETVADHRNAEMTDFATLPDQRGLGLAQHLLAALECDMGDRGIPNLYTVARARSAGMNRVFYNRGYEWTGTLVNNCHIAGRFEDMHVWCKDVGA